MTMKTISVSASLLAALASMGCAFDSATDEDLALMQKFEQKEQKVQVTYIHAISFKDGSWRDTKTIANQNTYSTTTFSFGIDTDIPLIVGKTIAVYGTEGARLGYFGIDQNNSRTWNSGDTWQKFLSTPQSGDQPFITTGQVWERNSSNQCVPKYSTGGLSLPISKKMVGIKRGEYFYVDRDGNGQYNTSSGCDLSGQFGASSDKPAALPPVGESFSIGVSRVYSGDLYWYIDKNSNLSWNVPPDHVGSANAFGGGTDYVPVSHTGGLSVQRGRHVYFDWNNNHTWDGNDQALNYVLPSSTWELVGSFEEIVVY